MANHTHVLYCSRVRRTNTHFDKTWSGGGFCGKLRSERMVKYRQSDQLHPWMFGFEGTYAETIAFMHLIPKNRQ